MQKPQRHRLLHGYPLAAAMRHREPGQPAENGARCPVLLGPWDLLRAMNDARESL
jgi:hypothetical protein